ncbi:hypothetical protein CC2G_000070 [Coprinopsis cinerea AmutBmut pab1-1]|nr:hypothetical protein CC2G_000070 [Coprinopsis cinerea AmutBmut pab1-1]
MPVIDPDNCGRFPSVPPEVDLTVTRQGPPTSSATGMYAEHITRKIHRKGATREGKNPTGFQSSRSRIFHVILSNSTTSSSPSRAHYLPTQSTLRGVLHHLPNSKFTSHYPHTSQLILMEHHPGTFWTDGDYPFWAS